MSEPFRIVIRSVGGPDVLERESIAVPQPGPDEILVRHEAIGVNFIDTYHRSGLYKLPLPSGLGGEAAGVVEAVGKAVSKVRVGDRVGHFAGPRRRLCDASPDQGRSRRAASRRRLGRSRRRGDAEGLHGGVF